MTVFLVLGSLILFALNDAATNTFDLTVNTKNVARDIEYPFYGFTLVRFTAIYVYLYIY